MNRINLAADPQAAQVFPSASRPDSQQVLDQQVVSTEHPVIAVVGLETLARNVPARVVDLRPAQDEQEQEVLMRLMEIGFLPGERVRIVATGFPGPDPLAVRVGQATFALRRHEAAKVLVSVEAKP